MKDLLDKISSYNIFNYLFPGVVFVVISGKLTSYNFVQEDVLTGAFVYYFIGLIISRVGSLFIEPVLKFFKFLRFSDYKSFVQMSKIDNKIELLSEVNNMYRNITSLFFTLIALKLYELYGVNWVFIHKWKIEIILLFLFFLFLYSYRKQTNFITKRIIANKQ